MRQADTVRQPVTLVGRQQVGCRRLSEVEHSVTLNEAASPGGAQLCVQGFSALTIGCADPHTVPGRSLSQRRPKHQRLVRPQVGCVFLLHFLVSAARSGFRPTPDELYSPGELLLRGGKRGSERWFGQTFRNSWAGHRLASGGVECNEMLCPPFICRVPGDNLNISLGFLRQARAPFEPVLDSFGANIVRSGSQTEVAKLLHQVS